MLHVPFFVERGGLASYSADTFELGKQAGAPRRLDFEGRQARRSAGRQPTKFELVITLKTAKAPGLKIPPALLIRADEVIQ
jgi:putative tryptophan/tyrosine transport system substrate-binding protein